MTPILASPINPSGTPPASQEAEGKARLALVDKLNWLERLSQNPDFTRYLEFVKQGADATRAEAENISTNDAAKRDAFAQRHFGLVAMFEWPGKALESARLALKALDEKQRAV